MLRRRVGYFPQAWWACPLCFPHRGLKTLDVREYKPLGQPIELRMYQRYTQHPNHQSGVQFLTHFNDHHRYRVTKNYIDYLHWGKEQGQARLPHRHQRVAFDFHDSLQPTRAKFQPELWPSRDPSSSVADGHPAMDTGFDPKKKVFSNPQHFNRLFSKRKPGEGRIVVDEFGTQSLLDEMTSYTDTKSESYFKTECRAPVDGVVPGINAPFRGEEDPHMMQSMSTAITANATVTQNRGRFSKQLYLNVPARHQVVSGALARDLATEIDRATNALYSKLVVLQAAQSGMTDYFCQGIDFEEAEHNIAMAHQCIEKAAALLNETKKKAPAASASVALAPITADAVLHKKLVERQQLLEDAQRYEARVDALIRDHAALLWRVFTAPRPLMTLINGKCRGTGCGLALFAKFAVARDSSEFVFDGPNRGLTPFGGLTHFLARPETSLKYPGLAEFLLLTGAPLFAGDVLRLGWTDLYCDLVGMDYHIKTWFDDTEHMHNDAIAWQLGHLLETTCKMRSAHSGAMERSAVTPLRARWVEDAFADQPSVEAILQSLSEMEAIPLSDANNTREVTQTTPFTLASVRSGVEKLQQNRLQFSLEPWDITAAPPSPGASAEEAGPDVEAKLAGEVFLSYVLERHGKTDLVVNTDRHKLRKWRTQRYAEYQAHVACLNAPVSRHIYARLEGCENRLVSFEFTFDTRDMQRTTTAAGVPTCSAARPPPSPTYRSACDKLKREIRAALGLPADRDIRVGWYLPTLDTAEIRTDEELQEVLLHDPAIEGNVASPPRFPPLYLIVKRADTYLSEWAYAVKHQLLLQSPLALKATLQLLNDVRGPDGGSEETLASLSSTIALEFRYLRRLIRRPDFYVVGQSTEKSSEEWADTQERQQRDLHRQDNPLRPERNFDQVFERNVELGGHYFAVRPRWSPRTLQDVSDHEVAALGAPLDFETDKTTELDVPTYTAKRDFIAGMINDAGVEIVSGLGERAKDGSGPAVEPLKSNASIPTNVSFYEMARHPWNDTPSSWRQDGFTAGSMEYFTAQYQAAQKALYDPSGTGEYHYWPKKQDADGVTGNADEEALLQDRFYSAFREGEEKVESWARQLRKSAEAGTLQRRLEIATTQEKVYDDEYYRWFIQPGVHPNPSGMLYGKGSGGGSASSSSSADGGSEGSDAAALHAALSSFSSAPPAIAASDDSDVVIGLGDDAALAGDIETRSEGTPEDDEIG